MLTSVRARVLTASIAVILALLLTLGWVLALDARHKASRALEDRLAARAETIAAAGEVVLGSTSPAALNAVLRGAVPTGLEVVIVRTDGSLAFVSEGAKPILVPESPEVRSALAGVQGRAVRPDPLTGESNIYLAVPFRTNGVITGAVRVSSPRQEIAAAAWDVVVPFLVGGLAAIVASATLIMLLFAPLRSALRGLGRLSRRLAEGRLYERVQETGVAETEELAAALDHMAESLEQHVGETYKERDVFGAVIQTMGDALILTDREGVVRHLNPAAARVFGIDASSATGKGFVEVVRDHEIVKVYRDALASGRTKTAQVDYGPEARMLRAIATPVEAKGQRSVMVMVQDLTDVQRLQDVRKEFVANVSHELRTPLASIRAAIEALEAGALEDRELAQDFLRRARVEVDAMTALVQRLLELSRIETGKVQFKVEPLDLKSVVQAAVDRMATQAIKRGLVLEASIPDGLPRVSADRNALDEILLNLLSNAIKFTPKGRVRVSARAGGAGIEVMVEDTGVGISSVHLPHVFERFYKVDRSRSSEGAGLGLAVAKHLVVAQGGLIWAESTPGKGSTFHFTLPRAGEPE